MRRFINIVESATSAARAMISAALSQIGAAGAVRMKVLNDTKVELEHIQVEERGKGIGTAIMQAICGAADEHGVTLELLPRSYKALGDEYADALDQDDLEAWYYGFGFDNIPDRSGDGSTYDEYLVRQPRVGK